MIYAGSLDIVNPINSLIFLFREEAIVHALKVRKAVLTDNFHTFFQLHKTTPNIGNCLLDLMLDSLRVQYLQRICRSYKPDVPVSYVLCELGFELTKVVKVASKSHKKTKHVATDIIGMEFLKKAGCIMLPVFETSIEAVVQCIEDGWIINTKDTIVNFSSIANPEKLLL